jgi:hypothetical protein
MLGTSYPGKYKWCRVTGNPYVEAIVIRNLINELFDKIYEWRHLPNYQLELRADLFFARYLPEVPEAKLGIPIFKNWLPNFQLELDPSFPTTQSTSHIRSTTLRCQLTAT